MSSYYGELFCFQTGHKSKTALTPRVHFARLYVLWMPKSDSSYKIDAMKQIRTFASLIATLLLCGCVANPPTKMLEKPPLPADHTRQKQPEQALPPASFEAETLYSLLVAELAGKRKRHDILLVGYMNQAEKTRDPGIVERATRLAIWLKADQAALKSAELWAEIEPDSEKAKQALTAQLVKAGQFNKAMRLLEQILESGGWANFEYLAVNSKGISLGQRNELIVQFDQLLQKNPKHAGLLFGKTVLLQMNGRIDKALETAWELDKIKHDNHSILLTSRLQHQLGKTTVALQRLEDALQTNPDDDRIRLLYAQMLVEKREYLQAQREFDILVDKTPDNHQLRMTLALITMENGLFKAAKKHLNQLLLQEPMATDAHYYLAQIAEREKEIELAVNHYSRVTRGDKSMAAHAKLWALLLETGQLDKAQKLFAASRAANSEKANVLYLMEADLLSKQDLLTQALALLDEALERSPKNLNLLYGRAMIAEKLNDLGALERDLRTILSIEPDNAMVLNALGYTLADRTGRYQEALDLITRANELKPNDPAITDSLGWTLFRLGNYQKAIQLLERALASYPDHEISAHLGEALWMSGDQKRAEQVWQDALERDPSSEILNRVIKRLNPEQIR